MQQAVLGRWLISVHTIAACSQVCQVSWEMSAWVGKPMCSPSHCTNVAALQRHAASETLDAVVLLCDLHPMHLLIVSTNAGVQSVGWDFIILLLGLGTEAFLLLSVWSYVSRLIRVRTYKVGKMAVHASAFACTHQPGSFAQGLASRCSPLGTCQTPISFTPLFEHRLRYAHFTMTVRCVLGAPAAAWHRTCCCLHRSKLKHCVWLFTGAHAFGAKPPCMC